MLQALLSGVASIKAQQTRMNVIGNNLANVNTTAFKGGRVNFQDMMSQTIRGASKPTGTAGGRNPLQYGLGVLVGSTDVNGEQGSLSATNRPTDFAVQGNGFFCVSNGSRIAYTRDGSFDLDADGFVVHRATGERMLGWSANPATGLIDTSQPVNPSSTLRIPLGSRTALQATTQVTWNGNLDSRAAVSDPARTTTVRIYDSLGNSHDLTLSLQRNAAANTWDWTVTGGASLNVTTNGTGSLTFDPATGKITSANPPAVTLTPTAAGSTPINVNLDFSAFTQVAQATSFQASGQNGFPPGALQAFSVGPDGVISGLFTNGLTMNLGQIATSVFSNPNGLDRMGSNLWRESDNSGTPTIGAPQTGGRGQITAGFLEQSNVDIGTEFTDMIITQRGFQANTRVVTTVDDMLQEVINMKR